MAIRSSCSSRRDSRVVEARMRTVATLAVGTAALVAAIRFAEYAPRAEVPATNQNLPPTLSYRSLWSVLSASSVLSVASAASLLSIGSSASILSIGSSNSILSVGSDGGFLSIGSSLGGIRG